MSRVDSRAERVQTAEGDGVQSVRGRVGELSGRVQRKSGSLRECSCVSGRVRGLQRVGPWERVADRPKGLGEVWLGEVWLCEDVV